MGVSFGNPKRTRPFQRVLITENFQKKLTKFFSVQKKEFLLRKTKVQNIKSKKKISTRQIWRQI